MAVRQRDKDRLAPSIAVVEEHELLAVVTIELEHADLSKGTLSVAAIVVTESCKASRHEALQMGLPEPGPIDRRTSLVQFGANFASTCSSYEHRLLALPGHQSTVVSGALRFVEVSNP